MDLIKNFFLSYGSYFPNYATSFQRYFSLGLCIFLLCCVYFIFKNKTQKTKMRATKFFAVLILVMQIAFYTVLFTMGELTFKDLYMPTSFNFIVMFLCVLTLFIPSKGFFDAVVPLAFVAGASYIAFPTQGLNLTPLTMHSVASIVSNYSLFLFAALALSLKVCKFETSLKWVAYFLTISTTAYYFILMLLIYPGFIGFFFEPPHTVLKDLFFPFEAFMLAIIIIMIEACYRLKTYIKNKKTL